MEAPWKATSSTSRGGRLAPSVLVPPAHRVRSHAHPGDRQVHQLRIDARPNAIHNRTLKTHDRRAPHAAKPEATRGDRHLQCTPRIAGSTSELVRASTRRGSGEEASGRPAKGGGIVAGAWLTIQYILWCWETARSTSAQQARWNPPARSAKGRSSTTLSSGALGGNPTRECLKAVAEYTLQYKTHR